METGDVIKAVSTEEDHARRRLIPCFDELYASLLRAISKSPEEQFQVLDLGAGTGFLTSLILQRFPRAEVTLLDVDDGRLEAAKLRLSPHQARTRYVVADYARVDPEGAYDLVVSAFSLHHISNLDKRAVYRTLYSRLNRNGQLLLADRVKGMTPELDAAYKSQWELQARDRGASDEDIARTKDHWSADIETDINDHLEWAANAGFRNVDISYKNFMFAVFGGRRPDI